MPRTSRITWPEAQGPVMANKVCSPKIAPAAWLKAGKFDTPVGSGPYLLDTGGDDDRIGVHVHQERELLERRELPVQESGGQGHHQHTAAVSALKTGQIDATLVDRRHRSTEVKASGHGGHRRSRARPPGCC